MPYTKMDYPDSMKNLDTKVRTKALDILNAMIEQGYEEDNAIPISISQAKSWVSDASDEELKSLKNKDITKHKKDENNNASRLQNNDVNVYYNEEQKQWAVKSVNAHKASNLFDTKKEAMDKAKSIADNRDSNIIEYKKGEQT